VAYAKVENANLACAVMAHEVAGNPTAGMKVIGVTGTKGKTTVAYLLRSVLRAAGHKVGMIGTVEIDDGDKATPADMTTPGSVELVELFLRMRANGVTHCVMEVSSHALHQHRVAGIDFAVGIFTNLTGDHLDYHKTMEEYAAAKAMLFEGLKEGAVAVVNGDDRWVEKIVGRTRGTVVHYGIARSEGRTSGQTADWTVAIEEMSSGRMTLTLGNRRGIVHLETSLIGKHNAYNVASVVVAANALGIGAEDSCKTLQAARGAPGRLQRVESRTARLNVFVDYAHTHDALENVLKALRATMCAADGPGGSVRGSDEHAQWGPCPTGHGTRPKGGTTSAGRPPKGGTTNGRLICVFGCGGDRDRTKRPKMGAVAERLADRVIVTSDNPRTEQPGAIIEEICAGFSAGWKEGGKIVVEADRREAIKKAIGLAEAGDVVLIAGKGHENYQIVGTVKHHFDDVEEAEAALAEKLQVQNLKIRSEGGLL
jgi:UDP-N-acetylmuramoyl-L-alanyl-D-glutamate--2,6-diaminopimelate ligase